MEISSVKNVTNDFCINVNFPSTCSFEAIILCFTVVISFCNHMQSYLHVSAARIAAEASAIASLSATAFDCQ